MLSAAFSVAVVTHLVHTYAADANKIKNDLETLRRTLMKDNYDYMYEDTSANSTEDSQENKNVKPLKQKHRNRKNPIAEDRESNEILKYPKDIKYFKARAADKHAERSENYSEYEEIYRDDMLARALKYDEMKYENISKYIVTPKYTILKPKHPSRRMSGQRFIQEEDGEGVALVNLGGGPVPLLHLPAARRQYMRGGEGLLSGTDNALVELVKQNLRRNNDDYADPNHYVIKTTTTIKNKSTNARRVLFIEVSKDKYNQKETVTTQIVKTKKVGNDDIVATENYKATPSYKLKEDSNVTNATNSNSIKSKKGARNRVETFEKFIKKNKDLFKDFTSKKVEKGQNIQFAQRQKKKMERNGEMSGEYIPNPNLLDMAPAKGARIENKRLQGRLCDRNVLIPEGPKYDGRGRSYRVGHPPPHTAQPHLVLPRCCNCCKKSVLGCE